MKADAVSLVALEGTSHFEVIDPKSPAWLAVLHEVDRSPGVNEGVRLDRVPRADEVGRALQAVGIAITQAVP